MEKGQKQNAAYRYVMTCLLLAFLGTFSQAQEKYYGMIGYGAGIKTFSQAYGTYSGSNPPVDITSLDLKNDRMAYSNWKIKAGLLGDGYLFDVDLTGAFTSVALAVYEYVKDEPVKRESFPEVGKLKKVAENTRNDAYGYGYDFNVFSMEFGAGAEGWLVSAYAGYSKIGTGTFKNTTGTNSNSQLFVTMRENGIGHLGLGLHKIIGDDEKMAQLSLRVNRMIVRSGWEYYTKEERRRGLEIYPSARIFLGESYGLYAELYYKFQRFKDFKTPADWAPANASQEFDEGLLPGSTSHVVGLTLGFFMPYSD
ncbi:MAG: hypothetical protein EP338_06320 [Bacteroidetes bacterium]|nr:MAG: hypothetical protein EP338_06320 [Bacteroidota bacterium]